MANIKLSILICSMHKRLPLLGRLVEAFEKQLPNKTDSQHNRNMVYETHRYAYGNIELVICSDSGILTIGSKRNILSDMARGEYRAFFDDDDLPSDCYIEEVMKGVGSGADCCSLIGQITTNGVNPKIFRHFLSCEKYDEINGEYVRYPNHLNCIKSSIAKQFEFPSMNHGEDTEWATQLHWAGALKTEHPIEKIIYFYLFKPIK